ncbi:hydroxysqualene dehydroxylase HpnE [Rhodoblastus acidophilus]|uniref:Hydroxysqualene dehydroxylase HpnE n=1 Tax=Candidatus Rhodoblastus alkanivorans TaxID=2954117 RepID=A0ABS9Z9A5_9HYPH|nr:hydroxysqualene dehydroxylase HpnE [Candidatus Rhodoblastus alkanivorans]MCI4678915.1 hydroxysqualene dehydroxylase HpnE [Candidatus Rhodoblastus alkanivorans]MCI4684161.1 hydroxysqualene dehydroxylase HpnE [Candidatus Rhodoblastus alkanivorans]MDI4641482.1 hydroxysqualene dehydroxylase HpnE [Rhodoblastus acidophilus]
MMARVHIVGAGLAGLSAAVELCGAAEVSLYEAAPQAGGRCRSYFDAGLNMTIDNGNHLLLSGNHAALAYVKKIGGAEKLAGPEEAAFDFCDLARKTRWKLRPNAGKLPWWILAPDRRVPNTAGLDYLALIKLLFARPDQTLQPFLGTGEIARNLWNPLFVSALNTDPAEASAALAGAIVRETFAKGGDACRPVVAVEGLSAAFVDPALEFLRGKGAEIRFGASLKAIDFAEDRAAALDFGDEKVTIASQDKVVLAVTAPVAAALLPGLKAPTEFRAIVNAHFAHPAPQNLPLLTGVIGAASEWLFGFSDRLSVTISAAERFLGVPREELAERIWAEVQAVAGFSAPLPAWQVIKEKRATFAATPAQDALRPGAGTAWRNLFLAGDWTQTGLPATIEGAVRSGVRAAGFCAGR